MSKTVDFMLKKPGKIYRKALMTNILIYQKNNSSNHVVFGKHLQNVSIKNLQKYL